MTFSIEWFTFYLSSSAKLKTCFSWKENLKIRTAFEEQKGTGYIRGNLYFDIILFRSLSSTKPCLRFLLIRFTWEIKGFYHSSWENEVDFKEIMYVSPKISAQYYSFKKLTYHFVDEIAVITMVLISSCY